MPTLADLQDRFATPESFSETSHEYLEEALVCDSRAAMRPTQVVEQKLRNALRFSTSFNTAPAPDPLRRPKPR